jgi:antitoxin VapB
VFTTAYDPPVVLKIKDTAVERLAAEVAHLAGETKIQAIRRALEERRSRLLLQSDARRAATILEFLKSEVWPLVPRELRGRRLTRRQEDAILGFGRDGV